MPNHNHIKYMHSLKNCTEKAQQLQDEQIKTNHNFFLTWDQWENLPAGFKYSTHPEHSLLTHTRNNHMKKSAPSTMPVSEASATAITKNIPAKKCLTSVEMCWDVKPYPAPMINAPVNALVNAPAEASSAKQDLGGEEFNMYWKTNTTPPRGQYDFCWDEPSSSQVVSVPVITVEAATPLAAAPYDFCWDDAPQPTIADSSHIPTPLAAAAEHQGGFDMCWGDPPLGRDGDNEGHLTAKPTTRLVNSAADNEESSESQDTQVSLTPSSALTEGSAMVKLEAGEKLLL
ncbi:hypothetical protein BDR04DRAFT_1158932 [Suillus decipiens]|nr:hypothetical protein BDR04DRAFT_1158932 [Suillus decipiens]